MAQLKVAATTDIMLYYAGRFLFVLLFKSLFHLKVVGGEHVPREGAFIVASNHVSFLDPPLIGAALNRRAYFIAKEELFRMKFLGWLLARLGVLSVKTDSISLSTFHEAFKRLKAGGAVVIFPEGTRSENGRLGEGRPGIGFLAYKASVPVVPAFIRGTEKAMPRNARFIRPYPVSVRFGRPFCVGEDFRAGTLQIMNAIAALKTTDVQL